MFTTIGGDVLRRATIDGDEVQEITVDGDVAFEKYIKVYDTGTEYMDINIQSDSNFTRVEYESDRLTIEQRRANFTTSVTVSFPNFYVPENWRVWARLSMSEAYNFRRHRMPVCQSDDYLSASNTSYQEQVFATANPAPCEMQHEMTFALDGQSFFTIHELWAYST